jgi:hypothetical protein
MENTTIYQINDPIYSIPKPGAGRPGMFVRYGEWHGKTAEFGIARVHGVEQIYVNAFRKKVFKQIVFDLILGTYDPKGIQKVGVCFLKNGNGLEFSLHSEEIVDVLRKLDSKEALRIWENQIKIKNNLSNPTAIEAMLSDKNLDEIGAIPKRLFDFGFFKGDTLVEYNLNHFIVSYQDKIVVVNPKDQIRFVIDPYDSKRSGQRKYSGMNQQEQLEEARLYIHRHALFPRKRQSGLPGDSENQ